MKKVFWEGTWRLVAEDGTVGGRIGEPTTADEDIPASGFATLTLRYNDKCPACDAKLAYAENTRCSKCKLTFGRFDPSRPVETATPVTPQLAPKPGTKQYKVITQRDEFFKSKFNPEALEELINYYASDGWQVVSMTATDVGSFLGSFWSKGGGASRQELIVLLERTVE
jgi:hypothetical protein